MRRLKSKTYHIIITILILLIGWGTSVYIYIAADNNINTSFADFENSKRFANSVERMGGKMAIVGYNLSKWFNGLWHGETLAYTVAIITVIIGCGYYLVSPVITRIGDE